MAEASPDETRIPESLEAAVYEWCLDPTGRPEVLDGLRAAHPSHATAIDRLVRTLQRADSAVGTVRSVADAALHERLEVGTACGPYVLGPEIGRGAFGRVYLAEQTEPVRRQVALKVLSALGRAPDVLARFAAERQVLAQLDHPNIARIHDAGTTPDGQPYFAMEYLAGQPIGAFADSRSLSIRARLRLFLQVCSAVQHAHQRGVIHRDLKPGNILVAIRDGEPEAKVIDFGLAKVLADDELAARPLATESGRLLGTPEYMSPEQAAGAPIDTRTDIYSLGTVLYELLCGRLPFPSERLRQNGLRSVAQQLGETVPPLPSATVGADARSVAIAAQRGVGRAELAAQLQGDLDQIVRCCLEKQRDDRYASVAQLAADVQACLEHRPVSVRAPTIGYLFVRFARRNRGTVVGAGLALFAIVAGAVATFWSLHRVTESRDRALAAGEAAERSAYAMAIASAQTAGETGDGGRMRELLDGTPPERRGVEWQFLSGRAEDAQQVIGLVGGNVTTLCAFAGRVGCFDRAEMQWIEYDAATGAVLRRTRWPWQINHAAAAPDGRLLAFGGVDGHVVLCDAATLAQRRSWQFDRSEMRSLEFTPDAASLVVGGGRQALRIDLASGTVAARQPTAAGEIARLDLAADGATAAFSDTGRQVVVWDLGADRVTARLEHPAIAGAVALSPDGSRLATACRDRVLRLWEVATGRLLAEQVLRQERPESLVFQPDGRRIVSGQSSGSVRWWDGHTLRDLGAGRGHRDLVVGIHCLPDGGTFTASFDGTLRRWSAEPPGEYAPMNGMFGTTRFFAAHPHRPSVFATSLAGEVACWSLETRELRWKRKLLAGMCEGLAVAADGSAVFVADEAGMLTRLDADEGTVLRRSRPLADRVLRQLRLRPDGTLVASLSEGEVAVFDAERLDVVRRAAPPPGSRSGTAMDMALHPGGRAVTVVMEGAGLRTFDLESGHVLWEQLDVLPTSAAFCPARGILCVGTRSGPLVEYEPGTGRVLRTLTGPSLDRPVVAMQFTQDGRRLLAAGRRNLVLDARDGVELLAFDNDRFPPGALLLLEDRGALLTGGGHFFDAAEVLFWSLAAPAQR